MRIAGLLLLMWSSLAVSATDSAFTMTQGQANVPGTAVVETSWRAKVGTGAYDVIGLHRYASREGKPRAVLLYLPGTNMNGELAITDPDFNLWLFLAERGIAVYALDYRTHAVPNEPTPDLTFMKNWTMEAFVDDAARAFDFIRRTEDGVPVFVGGFSRGVSYAYALAGIRDAAGLVALDGSFKRYRTRAFDRAAAMKRLEDAGEYGTVLSAGRGWASRTQMMQGAWEDPDGPATDSRFKTIGEQLSAVLYNAWGPGGLANPVDGVSSVRILARGMAEYDRNFPAIQNLEGQSIALQDDDPATALDDQFGKMTLPIIYFGSTNLGADSLLSGIYSASASGSRDVTINVLENHGHLDVIFGNDVRDRVFDVTAHWMDKRLAR